MQYFEWSSDARGFRRFLRFHSKTYFHIIEGCGHSLALLEERCRDHRHSPIAVGVRQAVAHHLECVSELATEEPEASAKVSVA